MQNVIIEIQQPDEEEDPSAHLQPHEFNEEENLSSWSCMLAHNATHQTTR